MPEEASTRAPEGTEVQEASAPVERTTTEQVLESQGLVDVSEAELMGEDLDVTEEKDPATSEPSTDKEEPEVEKEPEVKAEEEPEVKVEEEPEVKEPTKTPKGFVPLAAVQEARNENKFLKDRIVALEALAAKPAKQEAAPVVEPSEFDDFKVLTDDEFEALADDSAVDALKYTKQLVKYQDYQRKIEADADAQAETQEYLAQVYEATEAKMEEIVPGLFDAESEASAEFKDFAVDLGMSEDMFYLTDPSTRIILPGETEPLLFGEHAAQIIQILANSQERSTKAKSETVDVDKLTADLTAKLRTEIEAEVLSKLKTGKTFKSLSDIPASTEDRPEFKGKELTESEYAKLSEKEQAVYLAGE